MGYHKKTRTTQISLDLNSSLPGDVEIVYERRSPRSPPKTIHKTERHLLIHPPNPDTMPNHIPTALHPPARHYYIPAPAPRPQIVYTTAPAPQPQLIAEAPRTVAVNFDTEALAKKIAEEVVAANPPAAPAPAPQIQLIQTGPTREQIELEHARRVVYEQNQKVAALQREKDARDEADRERGRRLRLESDERRARSLSVNIRGGRGRSASIATDENGTRVVLEERRRCDHCGYDHRSRDCELVVRRDKVVALVPPPWESHRRSRSVNLIGYGEERPRGARYIGWGGSQY